jgi:hypothetical protein
MAHYEIQVVGHLDQRRASALDCERLRLLADGRSPLTFAAVDQAALFGLLGRLRDAGVEFHCGRASRRTGLAEWRPRSPRIRSTWIPRRR